VCGVAGKIPLFPAASEGDTDASAHPFDRPHFILTRRFRNALVRRAPVERRAKEAAAEAGFARGLQCQLVPTLEFATLSRVGVKR
jgi:hypothetical protein